MEHLCPQIEQLVRCFTCGSQTLPPYTLCVQAHVGCSTCVEYMSTCACGRRFLQMSNATFDWTMSALKFRCKYRANDVGEGGSPVSSAPGRPVDCADGWYAVQELRDHYLTGCSRNSFACPVQGCGLVARVDTVTDHYETAHGPFESLSPNCSLLVPKCVVFRLLYNKYKGVLTSSYYNSLCIIQQRVCFNIFALRKETQIIKKIFNGYFMFSVKPYCRKLRDIHSLLSIQNINPSDSLQYTYNTLWLDSNRKTIVVTVTLLEAYKWDERCS
ncbi:hypothetical protein AGLY_005114 [Aphis glycines]|uniref:Uncharacterized protein n=1 Tax=Aphis glycines TaxID=307491 RepID=A0A6G0TVV6_APHGL|nr:hypothetical protein AGLY_005114 [Aphis glycines]